VEWFDALNIISTGDAAYDADYEDGAGNYYYAPNAVLPFPLRQLALCGDLPGRRLPAQ